MKNKKNLFDLIIKKIEMIDNNNIDIKEVFFIQDLEFIDIDKINNKDVLLHLLLRLLNEY